MQLTFYSNKNQRAESLIVEPTADGWYLIHGYCTEQSDPGGRPYLQQCIEQHDSAFPAALPDAMEELWRAFQNGRLKHREIQERLNQFSAWLNAYQADAVVKLSDFSS